MKAYLFVFDFAETQPDQRKMLLSKLGNLSHQILPLAHNIFMLSFFEQNDLNSYLVQDYVNEIFDEKTIMLICELGTFNCQLYSKHQYSQWSQLSALIEQCRDYRAEQLSEQLRLLLK